MDFRERHIPDQLGRIRGDFLEEVAVVSLKVPLGWMWRRQLTSLEAQKRKRDSKLTLC